MTQQKEYLTPKEAAAFIGCSVETLKRQRNHNDPDRVRYIKYGRKVKYELSDIKAWLDAHKC